MYVARVFPAWILWIWRSSSEFDHVKSRKATCPQAKPYGSADLVDQAAGKLRTRLAEAVPYTFILSSLRRMNRGRYPAMYS